MPYEDWIGHPSIPIRQISRGTMAGDFVTVGFTVPPSSLVAAMQVVNGVRGNFVDVPFTVPTSSLDDGAGGKLVRRGCAGAVVPSIIQRPPYLSGGMGASPSEMLGEVTGWVEANPIPAAGIGLLAAYLLFKKKGRR